MVSPARLKTPLKRSADGALVAVSWEEAEKLLVENMRKAGASVASISADPTSSVNEILSALLGRAGSNDFYLMPGEEQPALKAWSLMGGRGRMGYDLEHSDFILSIGADLLETWGTVARNRRIFRDGRPAGEEPRLKLVYAGPVQNNTAVGADGWLPIKPGTEMTLALGVAHLLLQGGRAGFAPGLPGLSALLAGYTPDKVAARTGLDINLLTGVATALANARSPLVVTGSGLGAGGGAGPVMAGIAVNILLGRVGKEGNLADLPFPSPTVKGASEFRTVMERDLAAWTRAVAGGSKAAPRTLLIHEANPVYSLPPDAGMDGLMENREIFKIFLGGFLSETAARCDLALPAAFGLERFDDVYTPYGSGEINYSIAQPVTPPLYEARPAAELLIALAQELGMDLGVEDMPSLLARKAASFSANIKTMRATGQAAVAKGQRALSIPVYNADALAQAVADDPPEPAGASLRLAPLSLLGMGTAQTAIPPFATKIITDCQLRGPYSVVQINAATAARLGVAGGERLRLESGGSAVTVVVELFEGVAHDAAALYTGLGHTAFDEFSRGKGINIMTLTSVSQEPGTGLSVWGGANVSAVKA
jgi:anaerobic selenocysteine-containing dehydrogenase